MRIGAHLDPENLIPVAAELGVTAAQLFIGHPQKWDKKPQVAYPGGAEALRNDAAEADLTLFVHAPYRINVASTDNKIRVPSRDLLQRQVNAAAEIGAAGLVVHGGHVGAGADPQSGFENWYKAVDRLELPIPVLIENTAGGENAMARTLDRLEQLWAAIAAANGSENIGFCLDTCHAHAGGNEMAGLVDRVRAITGRIDLVHLNDSRDAFDSGADRHANLGTGHIAPEDLIAVATQADAPLMLETPGTGLDYARDVQWLKEHVPA